MSYVFSEEIQNKCRNPQLRELFQNYIVSQVGSPANGVASACLLTVAVQPTVGDTFTLGTKVYTFTTDETASSDGEIDVGADLADAKTLIVAAINGTDGINTANSVCTCGAFSTNDAVITALTKGTAGDSIVSTETFDNAGNIFDDETFGTEVAGVDGTVGIKGQEYIDSSYKYICIADNTIVDANWRRISLGSAY